MTDLIDTTEMYLKTVFELMELGVKPMRARIAERLGQSGPTVSQTVARMERDGLLKLNDERVLELTDSGLQIATEVMRKHRLAERHLIDVIGLEYSKVHEEACRWEHVMSLDVEKRIASLLKGPYVDPYGNPIPGLAQLGIELEQESSGQKVSNLAELDLTSGPITVEIVSIGEVIQSDVLFLADLEAIGAIPGAQVEVELDADVLELKVKGGGAITLSPVDASHIGVQEK